ncbi:MAG: glycosyltransferase [Coriobacteriales bacterium]|jgi:glycosyltransferase involved in cell wall biosynthesis|nr:glycosyltransferase [Coriobacteriales bacterium]
MPYISVVLPVFNAEPFLDDCLRGLLAQDFEDFEIIAINDGSTDASLAILRGWGGQDPRVRVLDQHNAGPGVTRNVGLDAATGSYVAFLDPDDIYHHSYLSRMYEAASRADADVTVCASVLRDSQSGELSREDWLLRTDLLPAAPVFSGRDVADDLFHITIGWPWDKLFKRSFLKEHGLRYPDLRNSEDGAFVYPALCLAQKITAIRSPLVQHTTNREGSLSNSRKDFSLCFFDALRIVRDRLKAHALYEVFERGFLGWVLDFSLWNLETAHPDDQQAIYDFLTTEGFDEMGVFSKPRDYYAVEYDYCRARALMDYHFPESLIIAKLQDQLRTIEQSRSYRLALTLARPLRALRRR